MSINQILEVLAQADKKLDTISVKSVDAYTMVDVRKLLRVTYDELRKEAEKNAGSKANELDSNRATGG